MSLYFNERMKEQIEDPEKNNIVFTYPWVIEFTAVGERFSYDEVIRTTYQYFTKKWSLDFMNERIRVVTENAWNGSSCFVSYNMYYDDDMRLLFYSSPRIKMAEVPDDDDNKFHFQTPDGFTAKVIDALEAEKDISKIVIFVEFHLPLIWFYRPAFLCKTFCGEYPENLEDNFKFMFLKTSDYSIKCLNGSVPASKMCLNNTSAYMEKHFERSNDNELVVGYSIDVVKPVVYYLHSKCFEMPPSYDLEYVHRLYAVIEFFEPVHLTAIRKAVQKSLGRKLVEENGINFGLILRYLSIARQLKFNSLESMISTMIATKYYFKWHDTFPENARNAENQIFRDVFGNEGIQGDDIFSNIFDDIEDIFKRSLKTNVILS